MRQQCNCFAGSCLGLGRGQWRARPRGQEWSVEAKMSKIWEPYGNWGRWDDKFSQIGGEDKDFGKLVLVTLRTDCKGPKGARTHTPLTSSGLPHHDVDWLRMLENFPYSDASLGHTYDMHAALFHVKHWLQKDVLSSWYTPTSIR